MNNYCTISLIEDYVSYVKKIHEDENLVFNFNSEMTYELYEKIHAVTDSFLNQCQCENETDTYESKCEIFSEFVNNVEISDDITAKSWWNMQNKLWEMLKIV